MKRDYKLSAAARRRRFFDVAHRVGVVTAATVTLVSIAGCAVFFKQFNDNKEDLLQIRRRQLEDEIASKQADALKALSTSSSTSS